MEWFISHCAKLFLVSQVQRIPLTMRPFLHVLVQPLIMLGTISPEFVWEMSSCERWKHAPSDMLQFVGLKDVIIHFDTVRFPVVAETMLKNVTTELHNWPSALA